MTIADTIFDTINDNWGNGGYAGTTPAIDTTETQTDSDVVTTDVVEVRHYSLRERGEQVNDKYVNRHYTIDVYISSKTDNAQLKLLYDEVEYLLRNTTMTGLQLEKIDKDWSVAMWEQGRHSVILRVYVVALLSDGAVTSAAGVTDSMQALLMYTSANAAWVPCIFDIEQQVSTYIGTGYTITNTGATDAWIQFRLPIPTAKGALKLYISGIKVGLLDADAGDYIDSITLLGVVYNTGTALNSNTTDYTAPAAIENTFAAVDCSSYDTIILRVTAVLTNTGDYDITYCNLRCYYDT